jgi:hypothetical protein
MSLFAIAEAANDLAALLEATRPKGLKHPRHARHVAPARKRVEALFRAYWQRQEAAILREIRPRLEQLLAAYPPPSAKLREADEGEWVTINGHPVLIGGGAAANRERVERAKKSQVRTGQHEQMIADRSEKVLSEAINVPRTRDNSAFDLRNDEVGIEVKTLVNGKNEKITMSKTALGRKLAEQRADGIKAYTVVVDRRSGGLTGKASYYIREGLGSFRLGSMTPTTLSEIRETVKP